MNLSFLTIVGITLIPTLLWFWIYYRKDKGPEPIPLILDTFGLGILTATFLIGIQWLSMQQTGIALIENLEARHIGGLLLVFFLALLEEVLKGLALFRFLAANRRKLQQPTDGLIYGVCVALGFAFFENIAYFVSTFPVLSQPEIIPTYFFRTVGTMFAHTAFSGIFGYFAVVTILGTYQARQKAKIERARQMQKMVKNQSMLRVMVHKMVLENPHEYQSHVYRMFFESLLVVTLFHFIFNALLSVKIFGKDLTFLTIPFLFFLGSYLFAKLRQKKVKPKEKTFFMFTYKNKK